MTIYIASLRGRPAHTAIVIQLGGAGSLVASSSAAFAVAAAVVVVLASPASLRFCRFVVWFGGLLAAGSNWNARWSLASYALSSSPLRNDEAEGMKL